MTQQAQPAEHAQQADQAELALDSPKGIVQTFLRLADRARREGLLSLEEQLSALTGDPDGFVRTGLMEVVDGTPPADIRQILEARIAEASLRLELQRQAHLAQLRMMLAGILSLQAGDAPRLVRAKVESHLAPEVRAQLPGTLELLPPSQPKPANVAVGEGPALGPVKRPEDFTVEHIRLLSQRDVQRLNRDLDEKDVVLALRAASPALAETILRGMSRRVAAHLRETVELIGPQRMAAIEEAQRRIVATVLRLESEEEIIIPRSAGEGEPQHAM